MNIFKKAIHITKKINSKIFVRAVACGLVFSAALSLVGFNSQCEGIRQNVLRMHIRANSDSAEDQALKLCVRDAILNISGDIFNGACNKTEAKQAAQENIELIRAVAQNTVFKNGYDYNVNISIGDAWFENRVYDDFTLPAGTYEAVRIDIGSATGKNWWCVMFPAVCVPAASGEISEVLDNKQTDIVEHSKKYVVRFKAVELYEQARRTIESFFKFKKNP